MPENSGTDTQPPDWSARAGDANRQQLEMQAIAAARLVRQNAFLLFQPIVHARQPAVVAFYEALLQIKDESGTIVAAQEFAPCRSDSHLERIIDRRALEIGLAALAKRPDLRLSVSISAPSLKDYDWMMLFVQHVTAHPTIAERLIIEVSESTLLSCRNQMSTFMTGLQQSGVCFALLQAGSSQRSLHLLENFQFDIIKLDQSLVTGLRNHSKGIALIDSLVSTARKSEMLVVAKGIEETIDGDILRELAVDCLQGFCYGRPEALP